MTVRSARFVRLVAPSFAVSLMTGGCSSQPTAGAAKAGDNTPPVTRRLDLENSARATAVDCQVEGLRPDDCHGDLRVCFGEQLKALAEHIKTHGEGSPAFKGAKLARLTHAMCDERVYAACLLLGTMWRDGLGVAKRGDCAWLQYMTWCEAGQARACYNAANLLFHGDGVPKDLLQALRLSEGACRGGIADACSNAGSQYDFGDGTAVDHVRSLALYRQACKGGSAIGCRNLAYQYLVGFGADSDTGLAVRYYARACEGDYAPACTEYGNMVAAHFGQGIGSDDARAAKLYRRACEARHYPGCAALGRLMSEGFGTPADQAQATSLFQRACDGGDGQACTELADRGLAGRGVPKDPAQASLFDAKAFEANKRDCEARNAGACAALGDAYLAGRGTTLNVALATAAFKRACEQRVERGCLGLRRAHAASLRDGAGNEAEVHQQAPVVE